MQDQLWAEIDLRAIAFNCRQIKSLTGSQAALMAAVKANAYGHGAVQVARTVLGQGATHLAVARLEEALELRHSGIDSEILLLGPTNPEQVDTLWQHDLTQTIFDLQQAKDMAQAARSRSCQLKCHLKLDTGMGRLGLAVQALHADQKYNPAVLPKILEIFAIPELQIQGTFTHLAQADSPELRHAQGQLDCFQAVLQELQQQGIQPGLCHAANSAGILNLQHAYYDLVRPGLILYGLYPELNQAGLQFKPAMQIKARIMQLKSVQPGFTVSYGSTYVAPRKTKIATLPIGYADGYPRILSGTGQMLVRGQRATVAGRVCMDQTMLDVGHIPDVQPGDEVVILGRQGTQEIRAEELGKLSCSINYEIVSRLSPRVPRIYIYINS